MFKKIFSIIKNRIIIVLAYCFPTKKDKVCMISYYGSGYNDSPKYIASSILKKDKNIKIYFGISHQNIKKYSSFNNIKFCDTSSAIWFYHLLTARVWVDNCRKTIKIKKKKTLYINTWHGSGLQKKIEADAVSSLDDAYIISAKRDSSMIDIMISDSTALTNLYKKSFWYKGEILEIGLPRYAPLIHFSKETVVRVKKELNIPLNKKIILYAPTFRNKNELYTGITDCNKIIDACKNRFGGDYCFLIKLHPNIADIELDAKNNNGAINVSKYENTQELLAATDVLISDFSSIIFDFSILERPAFRLINNENEYDRGLYFDFDKYPWPVAESENMLCTFIRGLNLKQYKDSLHKFYDFLGFFCVTHPDDLVADVVCDYINSKCTKKVFVEGIKEKYGK